MRSSRIAFRRAAAPCDPIDSLPAQQPDTLRRPGPDPGAAINAVNCTLDASPGTRTACHLRSSRTAFRRAAAPRDSTNSTRPFPLHHESPALVARPRPHSNFACSLDARAGSGCTFSLLSAPLNGPIPTRTIPNAPTTTLLYHGLGGGGKVPYPFSSVSLQYRILTSTKPRSCRLGVGPLGST